MTIQVPNFTNAMLNRVAQGDMSVFEEGHDFTLTEFTIVRNWNALIVAATKGYFNLVNRLLEIDEVRANAAAEDNDALRLAVYGGYLEVANLLLEIDEVRANAAVENNVVLVRAVSNRHLELVNRLLETEEVRVNAGVRGSWVLSLAGGYGYLEIVNRLLEVDEVRANMDNFALKMAARNGHHEVVNRLLEINEVRANAASDGNEALISAVCNGHLEVVNRLLEVDEVRTHAGARSNQALRWAAENGHLEVVNRLLEIEAVIENAAARNNEALICAAANGHSEVVHALAKAQWPLGMQDMPERMYRYLPLIKAGAQLYTAKREQERVLMSALQNKSVLTTIGLYAASSLGYDPRAHRLFTLPGDVVDSIASYAGYKKQFLADQIRKDDWQNAWNDMRRSERLYGLFTNTNTSSSKEQQALVIYKP